MASQLPTENEVFIENYPKLCNTLIDIDNLLKYFVQQKIIKPEDQVRIGGKNDKVTEFLEYISGPLQSGDNTGFYAMLNIMETHGVQATKNLAIDLKVILKKPFAGKGT